MKATLVFLSLVTFQLAYACPTGKKGLSAAEFKRQKTVERKTKSARKVSSALPLTLPTALSEEPWGGKNSKNWHSEAIAANAASRWLNTSWNSADVAEVLVSIPVKMIFTAERVYDDGQTNAGLSFGTNWKEDHPPLIATLVKFKNGSRKVSISLSNSISLKSPALKLTYFVENNRKDETITLENSASVPGTKVAEWSVPTKLHFGDLNNSRVVWVQPQGWDSSFPVDFRISIYENKKLLASAGEAKTAGKSPLDPLDIFARSQKNNENSQRTLLNSSFGPEWLKNDRGGNEIYNDRIHGEIHVNGQEIKNAVGGGLTWLVNKGTGSNFKNLYTCFEPRNFQKESQYGVPSGGGWHEIGDAAETIINDLETAPVLVGYATGLPWPTPPDQAKFAWGLSDVASFRLLMPGEAVVTIAGDQTWKEDEGFRQQKNNQPVTADLGTRGKESSGGGRNYHWFAFNGNEPTCTQEWVHNCRPTEANNLGLRCP